MEKHKNLAMWTKVGYDLFAHEGWQGIHVERLARITQLNKSGFYHYFGDLDGFATELINLHKRNINIFLQEIRETKNLDPDYFLLLVKHAATIMFQIHLTRDKGHHSFKEVGEKVDQWINFGVRQLWLDFMGTHINADLAMRYYYIVRDMFYTRANFQNLNYHFLKITVTEAKAILTKIADCKTLETTESLHSFVDDAV